MMLHNEEEYQSKIVRINTLEQRVTELEAEVARLQEENAKLQAGYEWIEDLWRATAQVRDDVRLDLNEAHYWAKEYRQRYNQLRVRAIEKNCRFVLMDDDPEWIPF